MKIENTPAARLMGFSDMIRGRACFLLPPAEKVPSSSARSGRDPELHPPHRQGLPRSIAARRRNRVPFWAAVGRFISINLPAFAECRGTNEKPHSLMRTPLPIIAAHVFFGLFSTLFAAETNDLALDFQSLTKPSLANPTQGSFRIVEGAGPEGQSVLQVRALAPSWHAMLTRLFSVPKDAATIEFSGNMRTEEVVGSGRSFTAARAQLVFLDQRGERVGDWPDATDLHGTRAWAPFRQVHTLPPGTAYVQMNLGLYNAVGLVQYTGLRLQPRDAEGADMVFGPPPGPEKTDTADWVKFAAPPFRPDSSPALDIPRVLGQTATAGSSGFVGVKNGRFEFEDGTPIRFWGMNISAMDNWRPPEVSAAAVERVRRLGFNLARLHHLDAGWAPACLFDGTRDDTQKFHPERLDRFFAMLKQLRDAGIYYYLDLLVTRKFKSGDGVKDAETLAFGAKIAAHFNRRLIDLQKDYAKQILTIVNPYTGLRLVDDPALAIVGIINESSMFLQGAIGSYEELPASYRDELDGLYREWREKKQLPPERTTMSTLLKDGNATALRFLMELQDQYYVEMSEFLRDELGVRVPIVGSNFQVNVADVLSNAKLDVYDVHAYHDHPKGGWGWNAPQENLPLIASFAGGNSLHGIARQRIAGMPLFVSEWQACWPNEFHFEGPLLFSTVASLQGWDGLGMFVFAEADWVDQMEDVFTTGHRPNSVAASWTASLIYRRGDIDRLPLQKHPLGAALAEGPASDLPAKAFLTAAIEIDPQGSAKMAEPQADEEGWVGGPQVRWKQGADLLQINAPRVTGFLGRIPSRPQEVGGFTFRSELPFAQMLAISLTDEPLAKSGRILVQAIARAENSGAVYRTFRKGLLELGRGPILLEPLRAKVDWKLPIGKTAQLQAVDWNGDAAGDVRPLAANDKGNLEVDFSQLPAGMAIIELTSTNSTPEPTQP